MLVRALKQDTGEELTQLVSESFTVSNYQLHCTCRCTSDSGGNALFTCALQTSSAISGQVEHAHAIAEARESAASFVKMVRNVLQYVAD